RRSPALAAALIGAILWGLPGATRSARAEDPKAPPPGEEARKENVERLEKDLRKLATGGHAADHKDDIRKIIESLGVLGGVDGEALKLALQALTGQSDLGTPRQFREWWNDHKKDTNW